MNIRDPETRDAALAFLRALGAPARLIRHGEIVSEVAILISKALTDLGVTHDGTLVVVGAALHDVGKIIHPEELEGPGREHEAAGERFLLELGISPKLASVCRSHGSWDHEVVSFEELLVGLADHIWKGTRSERLESLVIANVGTRLQVDKWEAFLTFDAVAEKIAVGANERLARART